MQPLPIIELKISAQARDRLRYGFVITDVDVFILDASPEPLNEDVVQRPPSPVHADGDLALFENPGERAAGELRTLISVEDLRPGYLQRLIQRAHTELALHRRRNYPPAHVARVPVDDRDQVNEAADQTNVRDVSAPNLIHPRDLHAAQQIRISLMARRG